MGYMIMIPGSPTLSRRQNSIASRPPPFALSASLLRELQVINFLSHFFQTLHLKLLLLLFTLKGEQAAWTPSATTPTGFTVAHVQLIIGFTTYIAVNRSHITNATEIDCKKSSDQSVGFETLQTTAIQFAVDAIIDASNGPLSLTMSNILRQLCTGNVLWYMIMDLFALPNSVIRNRALQLLYLAFVGSNGRLDQKQVASFEKVNGFIFLADRLCALPWEPVTSEILLEILFWRVKKGSGNVIAPGSGSPSPEDSLCGLEEEDFEATDDLNEAALRNSEEKQLSGSGLLSMFAWKSKQKDSPKKGQDLREPDVDTLPTKTAEQVSPVGPLSSVSAMEGSSSALDTGLLVSSGLDNSDLPPEKIMIPQILPSIFATLHNCSTPDQIVIIISPIHTAVSKASSRGASSPRAPSPAALVTIESNVTAFCTNKDWLHILCRSLLKIHRDLSKGEQNVLSRDELLKRYCDPIYNLIQCIFSDDLQLKPSSTRKYLDVFRIVNPKFIFLQLGILFSNILSKGSNSKFYSSSTLRYSGVY